MADVVLDPEAVLTREIRRHRDRLSLTAQELANRVSAAGGKLTRQAISNIENGARGVSVQELLLLAKALRVPPVLLLFPLPSNDPIEALPGQPVDTWSAVKWFTGEDPFPGLPAEPDEVAARLPLDLYRQHDRHLSEWRQAKERANLARIGLDPNLPDYISDPRQEALKAFERTAYDAELALSAVRSEMRRHGMLPPAIRDIGLIHIEGGTK